MKAHGKKTIDVCRFVGIFPNQVSRITFGLSVPSLKTAFKIEEMTGGEVRAKDFLCDDEDDSEDEREAA
jgi:transcriptional regulator with XRE-family HTH domain